MPPRSAVCSTRMVKSIDLYPGYGAMQKISGYGLLALMVVALVNACGGGGGGGGSSGGGGTGDSGDGAITQPWLTSMHQGDIHVETGATQVTVHWPLVDTTDDYTVRLTTDPEADLIDNPHLSSVVTSPGSPVSGYVFEDLTPGENVYIALVVDGVIDSWTAARPGVVGFDAAVQAIAVDESSGIRYLGGSFTKAGAYRGGSAILPMDGGHGADHVLASPEMIGDVLEVTPVGEVLAAAPDGAGGWYIGGDFMEVGGHARENIAQIDGQGRVTDWNPGANNVVLTLELASGTLYVGGRFSTIDSAPRDALAAFGADGNLTGWSPIASWVTDLAVSDGVVYVVGRFSSIDSELRRHFAAVDLDGGLLDWNPGEGRGSVTIPTEIAVDDGVVYVAGEFHGFGDSTTTEGLLAFDLAGDQTNWAPETGTRATSLAIDDGVIYVGGEFTQLDGEPRNHMAALTPSGDLLSWSPEANDHVHALAIDADGVIYAGGDFTEISGEPRDRLTALDSGGDLLDWNPGASATVKSLATGNGTVHAGGEFSRMGAKPRGRLAALDAEGNLTDWAPSANNDVLAVGVHDGLIVAGGGFIDIDGETRRFVASFNTDGSLTEWTPEPDDRIQAFAFDATGNLYIGGRFKKVNGISRNLMAQFEPSGTMTLWNPDVSGQRVRALVHDHQTLYAGGDFTVNAATAEDERHGLAGFDSMGDAVASWDPDITGGSKAVFSLAVSEDEGIIYAGENFTGVSGTARENLVAIQTVKANPSSTELFDDWNPEASDTVQSLAVDGDTLYAAGSFSFVNGQLRRRLAAFSLLADIDGIALTDWSPSARGTVSAIAAGNDVIDLGGVFLTVDEVPREGFASVDEAGGLID